MKPMILQYAVVFERTANNYCAYVPDLPGCISTGRTWEDIQEMIREAIAFHIEGMQEQGEPLPLTPFSLEEAIAYHSQLPGEHDDKIHGEYGDPAPVLSTTFEMVEVEVSRSPAPRAG